MAVYKPEIRIEPPICTETHPARLGGTVKRKDCPKCKSRDTWRQATYRDDVARGLRVPAPMKRPRKPLTPAPRCRTHPRYRRGCKICAAWSAYDNARRIREREQGTLQTKVPIAVVKEHLLALTNVQTGGWTQKEISRVTGISCQVISRAVSYRGRTGERKTVFGSTWQALSGLQPKGRPVVPYQNNIDPTEAKRIVQGLHAQGWSFIHMASLLGAAKKWAPELLQHKSITRETLDKVYLVRDKLGPYDISEIDEPLPGMNRRAADAAESRGWVPLCDWDGLDMTDPNVQPFRPDDTYQREISAGSGRVLVDLFTVEQASRGDQAALDRMTWFEAYLVVEIASRDSPITGKPARSARELATWFGYDPADVKRAGSGQRHICRMRSEIRAARSWIERKRDRDVPTWYCGAANRGGDYSATALLAALMFLQPEPYGAGETEDHLQRRLKATPEELSRYLDRARTVARNQWKPRHAKSTTKRARRRPARNQVRAARAVSSAA